MLSPWPCFATDSKLPEHGSTGVPSQTGEMSPDRPYGKTMPRVVSSAGSNAMPVPVSRWSKCSQNGVQPPSRLGCVTGSSPPSHDIKSTCLLGSGTQASKPTCSGLCFKTNDARGLLCASTNLTGIQTS